MFFVLFVSRVDQPLNRELSQKFQQLQKQMSDKDAEIQEMRRKLLELADWDIARTELMSELDDLKNEQEAAALDFKKHIETMEEKYNEEKVCGDAGVLFVLVSHDMPSIQLRQRKETEAEIAQLAATAHDAAVAELDKTTQQTSVFVLPHSPAKRDTLSLIFIAQV